VDLERLLFDYRGAPTWDVERCCWSPSNRFVWFRGDTFIQAGQVYQELVTGRYAVSWARPGQFPQPPYGSWGPANLAGCVLTMTAKLEFQDQDPSSVFQIDSAVIGGLTITTPGIGSFKAVAPAISTLSFGDQITRLVFDLRVKDASSNLFRGDEGEILVVPTATRSIT